MLKAGDPYRSPAFIWERDENVLQFGRGIELDD